MEGVENILFFVLCEYTAVVRWICVIHMHFMYYLLEIEHVYIYICA